MGDDTFCALSYIHRSKTLHTPQFVILTDYFSGFIAKKPSSDRLENEIVTETT